MNRTVEFTVGECVKTNKDTFLGDEAFNYLESEMTVCVATICEKGELAIIASDRLFTSERPLFLELEYDIPKTIKLTDNCAAALIRKLPKATT